MIEQMLIVAGLLSLFLLITTGALTFIAVRKVRRLCRSARQRLQRFALPPAERPGIPGAPRSVAVSTVGSAGWWAVQNRRHRMWRAVAAAENAVAVARRADVPVGDLPALASQLGAAARRVDGVLRAAAPLGSLSEEDRAECARIEATAGHIHAAALSSLRSAAHVDTRPLLSAAQLEVAALAAGVRAAHH